MTEWLTELRGALDREFAAGPRVCALATVSDGGWPRVRSVVCRAVTDAGHLWVVSDRRSRKNAELRQSPRSEVVFWLPAVRLQFRLTGEVSLVGHEAPRAAVAWAALSDAARALFYWPSPLDPVQPGQPPPPRVESLDECANIPESFELLVLAPIRIDRVDLNPHPHARRVWSLVRDEWLHRDVNP